MNPTRNDNQKYLDLFKRDGFDMIRIRKALVCLNGVRIDELARETGILSQPHFYAQLKKPSNREAAEILAERLNVRREDLFPELEVLGA